MSKVCSLFPCYFNWSDLRVNGAGIVNNMKNGDFYGKTSKASNGEMRRIFLGISLIQIPFGFCRIIYRIFALINGDWKVAGKTLAERKFRVIKQEWLAQGDVSKTFSKGKFIREEQLKQLIINVVKVVTYPLAILALQLASLYGYVHPVDGRGVYGSIEHFWSRNGYLDVNDLFLGDYLAPCMQPDRVWKEKNLYQGFDNYYHEEAKSLLLKISNEFLNNQKFFENEGLGQFKTDFRLFFPKVKKVEWIIIDRKISFNNDQEKGVYQLFNDVIKTIDALYQAVESKEDCLIEDFKKEQVKLQLMQQVTELKTIFSSL